MFVQMAPLFIITLLAYFVKGLTGFGNTLVMNSLLSLFKENRFITPIDLMLSIPTNTYMAWKNLALLIISGALLIVTNIHT